MAKTTTNNRTQERRNRQRVMEFITANAHSGLLVLPFKYFIDNIYLGTVRNIEAIRDALNDLEDCGEIKILALHEHGQSHPENTVIQLPARKAKKTRRA